MHRKLQYKGILLCVLQTLKYALGALWITYLIRTYATVIPEAWDRAMVQCLMTCSLVCSDSNRYYSYFRYHPEATHKTVLLLQTCVFVAALCESLITYGWLWDCF